MQSPLSSGGYPVRDILSVAGQQQASLQPDSRPAMHFLRTPAPPIQAATHATDGGEGLLAFAWENDTGKAPKPPVRGSSSRRLFGDYPARWVTNGLVVVAATAIIAAIWFGGASVLRARQAGIAADGRGLGKITVNSRPAGAEVLIDGQRKGATPLTIVLKPGTHSMAVRLNGTERVLPVTLAAGSESIHYLELVAPASVGRIVVKTDPAGARVKVDGRLKGVSPLTVGKVSAGQHTVTVTSEAGSAERLVSVDAGGSASVVFSFEKPTATASSGWIAVVTPFPVQVVERGEVIGSSETTQVMVTAGRHDLVLANPDLGYESSRRVDVERGKIATLRVEAPKAAASVNARPWANVWMDGTDIGETPIANVLVPIGAHELLFRHPQLGERRQTIVVTKAGPNRMAVDLTK